MVLAQFTWTRNKLLGLWNQLSPSKTVPDMRDWIPGTSEEEEGVTLCNVQPREDAILEEMTINWNGLATSEVTKSQLLIQEYADIFALNPCEVGRTEVVHHSIDTKSHLPINQVPHRILFLLCPKVEALIQEMESWKSPVVCGPALLYLCQKQMVLRGLPASA